MQDDDYRMTTFWTAGVDAGLAAAIKAAGNRYRLAQLLGVHPTSVLRWKKVPVHPVLEIEEKTGVPREILRPDLYRQRLLEVARRQPRIRRRSCAPTLRRFCFSPEWARRRWWNEWYAASERHV